MRDKDFSERSEWRDIMEKPLSGDFPESTVGKESTCNVGDLGLISGVERSPGEQKGYPRQYSGLEYSMDCIVHGVTKSQTHTHTKKESDMTERLSLSLS